MGIVSARRFTLALLTAALSGSAFLGGQLSVRLSAQGPGQGTVFRSGTQLVRVDAVVVDKDGKPVRGLTKDDFEILDKKTLRPVEALEEISYDRPASGANAQPERLSSADNHNAATDRRVLLVIDEPRVMISRTSRAREAARRIVMELGGRVQMSLLRTNGGLSCEFTKDTRLLLDTVDGIKGEKTYFDFPRNEWAGTGLNFMEPVVMLPNLRDRGVYPVIRDAANTLSYDNGRRTAVVLVSEGRPVVPRDLNELGRELMRGQRDNPYQAVSDREELQWMVASARHANVAVYAIDPRGKVRRGDEGYSSQFPGGFNNDISQLSQESLNEISALTGGFAVTNTDDIEGGAKRILDELDHYYLLGFSPANPNNSSAREITVRVKRPGLTVRHRLFFSAAAPKAVKFPKKPTNRDYLQSLISGVTPLGGLPVKITAVSQTRVSDKRVRVSVRADATASSGDGVDFGLWVIDISRTKVLKQSNLPLLFSGSSAHDIELSPGRYQLRLAARTKDGGSGGSAYLTIDVPK